MEQVESIRLPIEPSPRTVIAVFQINEPPEHVDSDEGPLDWFCSFAEIPESEGLSHYEGIELEDAVLCDEDDDELWDQYHMYLAQWIMDNHDISCKGSSPRTYDQWLEQR